MEALGVGVIWLAADGSLHSCSARAARWLRSYFAERNARADRLPGVLARWIRQAPVADARSGVIAATPTPPLVIEREGRRLTIRLVPDVRYPLLLLDERSTRLQASELQRFGLTLRESEVLGWVSQGKTNAEAAALLGTRPRTVHKHLDRIFRKLGVENRTAAAVFVLTLLAG